MNKRSTMIIDDEIGSIKSLQWELNAFKDELDIVATTQSPTEGLELLKQHQPQLLFLDVEMPGMNGFELLENAGQLHCDVVFTTAYDEFAVKAFEVSALDYLLKPVSSEELARVMEKVQEKQNHDLFNQKFEFLLKHIHRGDPRFRTIVVPTMESLDFIEVDTIIRCEADSNYTRIFRTEGKTLMVSKTLKSFEKMVDGMGFFRVHNSHLVNVRFIKQFLRGEKGTLILKDGTCLPVSRSRKLEFLKNF